MDDVFCLQILQTGHEINEIDNSGFSTQGPTVYAANLGNNKYIVQVTTVAVRLLQGILFFPQCWEKYFNFFLCRYSPVTKHSFGSGFSYSACIQRRSLHIDFDNGRSGNNAHVEGNQRQCQTSGQQVYACQCKYKQTILLESQMCLEIIGIFQCFL